MVSGVIVILPKNRWSRGNLLVCLKQLQPGIKIRRHSSSSTGSRTPCQFALSGNSGAVRWRHACVRLCLGVRVFECAWLCPFKTELSAIRSLPGRLCVCVWSRGGEELDAEIHGVCSCTVKWNNSQNAERNNTFTDTREALLPLRFHGCFERKRQRLTGITELLSAQPAGREFLCKLGAPNLRIEGALENRILISIWKLFYFWSVHLRYFNERWV